MRGEYEREQAWSPAYVADLLRETELRRARYERDATLTRAEAQAATDAAERDRLARRGDARARLAEQMAQRVRKLETIHQARVAWFGHTAAARHRAERADAELSRRHPEQAQIEQLEPEQTAAAAAAEQQAQHQRDHQAEQLATPEPTVEQAEVEVGDDQAAEIKAAQPQRINTEADMTAAVELAKQAMQVIAERAEAEARAEQARQQEATWEAERQAQAERGFEISL